MGYCPLTRYNAPLSIRIRSSDRFRRIPSSFRRRPGAGEAAAARGAPRHQPPAARTSDGEREGRGLGGKQGMPEEVGGTVFGLNKLGSLLVV